MKYLLKWIKVLISNPKRFINVVQLKFIVPSNPIVGLLRRLYIFFVPKNMKFSDGNTDRLLLVYDTISNAVTFDFLHVLYYADWHRRQTKKTNLDVLIVSRSDQSFLEESYTAAVGNDSSDWRFTNLLIPLCKLFPSVGRIHLVDQQEALEIVKGYQNIHPDGYSYLNFKTADVRLDKPGVKFQPTLTIPDNARKIVHSYFPLKDNRQIVTITLRTYGYIPARNSNIKAWLDFARGLDPLKYRVVFVPDASMNGVKTIEELNKFEVFDAACWNIYLRAALYQRAWMNMGVLCGPMVISALIENVITIMIDRTLDYPQDYARNAISMGHYPGKVPIFYSKNCHYHLGKDDKQTIMDNFNKYAKQ